METSELRTRLRAVLNRRPWVPVRVEVADGRHTVIDTPLRVKLDGNNLVVDRFDGPTAAIPAEDVARLVPLDELPGENGGMSYREFRAAYTKFRFAEPFAAYEVELLDGTRLVVTEPGQFLINARVGSYARGTRKGFQGIWLATVKAVRPAVVAEVA